jgi:hypothetical protein
VREVLFILLIIALLCGLTALRYRRQFFAVWKIWRQLRDSRISNVQIPQNDKKADIYIDDPLVNCAKCGKWQNESSAIRLGKKTYFCSTNCMEKHSQRT